MKNNNFENNIKESFAEYNPQLNHDEIWDNIEPHLKKKKKRRGFIWFWFLGLGLLILGIGLSQKDGNETQAVAPVSKIEVAEHHNSPKVQPKDKVIESTINSSIASMDKTESKRKQFKNKSYENPIQQRSIPVELSLQSNLIVSKEITSVAPTLERNEIASLEKTIAETRLPRWPAVQSLETLALTIPSLIALKEKEMELFDMEKTPIEPFKNKWRTFFQPYIGATYAHKTLKDRSSFETTFLRQRKDSETQLESISAGFNFQVQNRKGFIIISGLEYQRINERFDHQEMSVETSLVNGIVAQIENADGVIVDNIMGNQEITYTTIERWEIYNQYNLINIPFGIGKAVHRTKYDLKYTVGLDLNIFSRFKGTQFNQSLNTIYINEIQSENRIYKKQTGLGLWMGIEYHRPFNKKFSWVIAPKIQVPLNSMTTNIYELDQRYYRVSLNLGINVLL